MGQVYQCWWSLCREINGFFFFQFRISNILRFISVCDLFTDSPSYVSHILIVPLGLSTDFQAHGFKKHYLKLFSILLLLPLPPFMYVPVLRHVRIPPP
jgi:hypothetical protein